MVRFNQFSIVEKDFNEKLSELTEIGFTELSELTEKEILSKILRKAPIAIENLQATASLSLLDFLSNDEDLSWEIFYSVGLQLLDFVVNFEFDIEEALTFVQTINLPLIDVTANMSPKHLIEAFYLLLCSRSKLGMTLVEKWISDGLLPIDNNFHFFNDKSLATFDMSTLIREIVYVETSVDTLNAGCYDLVKIQILRPSVKFQLPVVMTASPYYLGINETANDHKLHKMNAPLIEKKISEVLTDVCLPELPQYKKISVPIVNETTEHFVHGWTSSLNDYLLARGFASIYVAGVGTRSSDGFQTSGDYQQIYSMKAAIDWLNGRTRAFTDRTRTHEIQADWATGKVATTGKSYLGTMSYGLATTGVDGLEVILAESGISSWYNYYRENGLVRSPGGFPGEDLDVLAELTYSRNLDGADYLRANASYQKKLSEMTQALDRNSGDYNQFWTDRNYLPHIENVKCDVLIEHGLQDWNVTPEQAYNFWQALSKQNPKITKHAFLHRGAHIYANDWQSVDYIEIVNTYFSSKLLHRPLNLNLPSVILQENDKYETWTSVDSWGSSHKTDLQLGNRIVSFNNAYDKSRFTTYSKDFNHFKKDLFNNKANSATIDLTLPNNLFVNGSIELQLTLKLNDTKGLLSVQILDFGDKKRLFDNSRILEAKALDRGRNFLLENLTELPLVNSPHQLLTKGFMNLQNRDKLTKISSIPANEWFTTTLKLQPQIYQLTAGETLRILLYSTDFEHTIRDNRKVTYDINLAQSKIIFPIEDKK